MSEIYAVEIDHDLGCDSVDVEFSDGSCKSYRPKPVSRDKAIEIISNWVKKELKKDDAFERLGEFVNLTDFEYLRDYEITDRLIQVTNDYGYFVKWPNNQPQTGEQNSDPNPTN